jgi:hypothetical protein
MNDQLQPITDESLDLIAGGALVTLDLTGTVKGLFSSVATVGGALVGLVDATVKTVNTVAGVAIGTVTGIVDVK